MEKSLREYSPNELEDLCAEIRAQILEVVSNNGGHLSSALGAVEIIVAMHAVFDCSENPFIFDVSHQAYAHKILTGRKQDFHTLRTFGGISGFTHPKENLLDYFIAGHSSTSISLSVGAARAFRLNHEDKIPIVVIGDGSMSAGLAYEALNELGERKYPVIIILNDNEMSIAKPIGAISRHLSSLMSGSFYQGFRDRFKRLLNKMPESATYFAKRFEEGFKLITPGILFEELGIHYIGPIDGHDLNSLIHTLKIAKDLKMPVLIHAQTMKGKGYALAEGHFEKWHGVGPFELTTGESKNPPSKISSPTQVYAKTLLEAAKKDVKILGVTAAMPSGTGLDQLMEYDGNRFWDVGIAEQHAITSSAALAKEGFKPYVSIYSTFLQRGYDQIIHDVGILGVPVRFAIDRAGIVGEDGETHQGLFDIAFFRIIPNFILYAPRDNASLAKAVHFSLGLDSAPCAFRYPRGSFMLDRISDENLPPYPDSDFILGKCELLLEGQQVLLLGYGNGVGRAEKVRRELLNSGIRAGLLDLRFLKPLDEELAEILARYQRIYVFSDSYLLGGVGSAILEFASQKGLELKLRSFEVKDEFIPHGTLAQIEKSLGFDDFSQVILEDMRAEGMAIG